ncbi:MAG: metal-dependent hydrolase [Myxococcales bacterium]
MQRSQTVHKSHADLHHRKTKFAFDGVPRHWNGGDPFITRFLDALSINFPEGERFFMESVRAFETQVDDPKLREDVKLFSRQEAQHGAAHSAYNRRLTEQGVKVERIIKGIAAQKRWAQRELSPKMQLALTAAAEHLTATLAEGILAFAPFVNEAAHPEMRALFLWHAVEEVEHKAVAFDVYRGVARGDYLTRTLAMVYFTLYLHVRVAAIMGHMFEVDGIRDRPRLVARGLWGMYGPRGFITRMIPSYLAWFKPSFHPWDSGMPEQVARWIAEYEKHQDPLAATRAVFPN